MGLMLIFKDAYHGPVNEQFPSFLRHADWTAFATSARWKAELPQIQK